MTILSNAYPGADPYRAPDAAPMPWPEFRAELLSLYRAPLRAPATCRGMRYAMDCLEALEVKTTFDLSVACIANLVAARPLANSPNSTLGLLRYTAAICAYAERSGRLRTSPFRIRNVGQWGVRKAPAKGKKFHSRETIRKVLDHMSAAALATGWKGWKAKRLYILTKFLACTGVRAGEAFWAQVNDIDLDRGIFWIVSRQAHRTKTADSAQPIPLPPSLLPDLRDWIQNHRMARPPGFALKDDACPWVFPTIRRHGNAPWLHGGPGCTPRARMMAVAAEAGVAGFNPLSLRHSFATHLVTFWKAGKGQAQRILRHSSEKTQEWYIHDSLENLRDAVKDVEY